MDKTMHYYNRACRYAALEVFSYAQMEKLSLADLAKQDVVKVIAFTFAAQDITVARTVRSVHVAYHQTAD